MMENRKQVNFYRLALAEGKRFRMELSDDYRLDRNRRRGIYMACTGL